MIESNVDEEKIRYISLVKKEGGEPILGIPYREMRVDPDLIASFVLAVVIYEGQQLRNFTKEGYHVIIEEGTYIVGILVVDKVEDDEAYRESLLKIISRFEENYKSTLENWRGDIRPFREFALSILSIFPYTHVNLDLVPSLVSKSEATPDHQQEIPWSVGETNQKIDLILGFINGKRTVREIIDASQLPEREVIAIFSMLDKYNWIVYSRPLTDDTVLVKVRDPPMSYYVIYGEQLKQILSLFNGKRTLKEVCNLLPAGVEVVRTIAKTFISINVLAHKEDIEESSTPQGESEVGNRENIEESEEGV